MTKKALIESLGDLATFFTLAGESAVTQANIARDKGNPGHASFNTGRKMAYDTAFAKINVIITEAKE